MFRSWLQNPVHITGALRHCYLWATSPSGDTFVANPNFNPEAPNKTSIYCVHGTADRGASFSLIADRMKAALPENVDGVYLLTFDERAKGASVETFAKQLKDKIVLNKSARVILMGHSRGALITSWFTENLAAKNDVHVDLVVSICGPFRGSYLALGPLTAYSSSVDEMRRDSEFLQRLSEQVRASTSRYVFVGAANDYIVTKDCWLPYHLDRDVLNCQYFDKHGHLSIMSSWRLVDWLTARIFDVQAQELQQGHCEAAEVIRKPSM